MIKLLVYSLDQADFSYAGRDPIGEPGRAAGVDARTPHVQRGWAAREGLVAGRAADAATDGV